jgi:hypothetical protein
MPPDESAVPEELVPGAPTLVPNAPPVEVEWCIPMPPPPRLKAAVGATMEARTHTVISIFMTKSSVCILSTARRERGSRRVYLPKLKIL